MQIRNHIHSLYALAAALILCCACMPEETPSGDWSVGGGEVWVDIPFSNASFGAFDIRTKATMDIVAESRVSNIYLFIFDPSGDLVLSHFFFSDNRVATVGEAIVSEHNCWTVSNSLDTSDPYGDYGTKNKRTQGVIHVKVPVMTGDGFSMYAISNIDADMVNISSEQLNGIRTKSALISLSAHLNQPITSRNGYFPMTAIQDNITTDANRILADGAQNWELAFSRLDAKVVVNLRIATDNELLTQDTDKSTMQTLKSFIPETWQVVNLPRGSRVFPTQADGLGSTDPADAEAEGYFDSPASTFEEEINCAAMDPSSESYQTYTYTDYQGVSHTVPLQAHRFSFYMMENRESGHVKDAASLTRVHDRSLRLKDPATGAYQATSGDMWKYASQNATYLIIKGTVLMDVDVSSEAKTQELSADVVYVVHLGDFAADPRNFDIWRNTFYTYTITIKGVQNIALEVTSSRSGVPSAVQEVQSGAMGLVSIARESSYTFDAHYGQRVFSFDAANIDPDNIHWYVKTPFGKEGIPPRIAGKDVPAGYDYQWIHMTINEPATAASIANEKTPAATRAQAQATYDECGVYPYKHTNRPYPGTGSPALMDVVEFTELMRTETRDLNAWLALSDAEKQASPYTGVFRPEWDQEVYEWALRPVDLTDPKNSGGGMDETGARAAALRWRIYVTIYVDEFYYDKNPLDDTAPVPEDYWKQFVNQPNRLMFLLCDSDWSLDGDSNSTGSVITIRQRSIQTPYNLQKESLKYAWGTETIDETAEAVWFYDEREVATTHDYLSADPSYPMPQNTTDDNGLYNTACLWTLVDNNGNFTSKPWDTFLDYDLENDKTSLFLKDDPDNYKDATMRWSCLMRNRDENGDGQIDPEEVRWYMASIQQIFGLFFGAAGLTDLCLLFPRYMTMRPNARVAEGLPQAGAWDWRLHYVTSTVVNKEVREVWAEEGISVSNYKQYSVGTGDNAKPAHTAMRCVRNLGMSPATAATIGDVSANKPESLVKLQSKEYDPEAPTDETRCTYTFDNSNINAQSLRFYTSKELEPSDEHSEIARLYSSFQTGPSVDTFNGGSLAKNKANYVAQMDLIRAGQSPCPEGWRMPNLRELGVMWLLCDPGFIENGKSYPVSTWYSFGPLGNGYDGGKNINNYYSWFMPRSGTTFITIGGDNAVKIRCVRDL